MKIEHFDPRVLSRKEKDDLGEKCHPIAIDAFGTAITLQDVVDHVTTVELLITMSIKEQFSAFASFATVQNGVGTILHLHGICVASNKQGRGIFETIVQCAQELTNASLLSTRTQNPRLYRAVEKNSLQKVVFPNCQSETPRYIKKIGEFLVSYLDLRIDKYNSEEMAFRDIYPQCLYPHIPMSKSREVNSLFSKKLSITEGKTRDALLLISPIKD